MLVAVPIVAATSTAEAAAMVGLGGDESPASNAAPHWWPVLPLLDLTPWIHSAGDVLAWAQDCATLRCSTAAAANWTTLILAGWPPRQATAVTQTDGHASQQLVAVVETVAVKA